MIASVAESDTKALCWISVSCRKPPNPSSAILPSEAVGADADVFSDVILASAWRTVTACAHHDLDVFREYAALLCEVDSVPVDSVDDIIEWGYPLGEPVPDYSVLELLPGHLALGDAEFLRRLGADILSRREFLDSSFLLGKLPRRIRVSRNVEPLLVVGPPGLTILGSGFNLCPKPSRIPPAGLSDGPWTSLPYTNLPKRRYSWVARVMRSRFVWSNRRSSSFRLLSSALLI